ncbi:hypothetical protein BDK61_3806 [Haloarcula quadrata]|jgi:hypothetical protein|uniref:Uncharacterized protein n=2 Tax=Haloarcula TaxID=2237 RepID=Q5UWN3_HALMA|nr:MULTISPECIES: hypothetical protein [Haloarcula]AAV48320.1 unknown [Haloarcula marismortui ATCC 43049]QCP89937.1 hypothetical protein E6P14_02990 [Haloarcula marismortui ATCC 43049]RKS78157.1 hypothetical protein BDK61_3806 [Haloarcula quadrata]
MPPIIDETVFGEPSRGLAVVYLCGALLLAGQQVYYVIVEGATPFYAGLFLSTGMALSGIAESLPNPRRRAAGVLRVTALVVLVSMLVILFVTPDLLIN